MAVVAPLYEFTQRIGLFYSIGSLSLSIFRREATLEIDVSQEIGSNFIHVFLIANAFMAKDGAVFV